jgi:5-methylcytosine-specific restriction protein A
LNRWPYTTSRWKRLRLAKLAVDPLCAFHAARGEVVAAEVVDHNTPVRQGGDPFPSLDRLTSLCISCHNEKTARMDQGAAAVTGRRFRGCDEAGNPLDRADGWWS